MSKYHPAQRITTVIYTVAIAFLFLLLPNATPLAVNSTVSWSTKSSMPTTRLEFASTSSVAGKIYVFGGTLTAGGTRLSTVDEYDPTSNIWVSRSNLPGPARYGSGAVTGNDGNIYVIGGGGDGGDDNGYLRRVDIYNPTSDTWSSGADMPTARTNLAIVKTNNGKIYALGGYHFGGPPINTVEEYDPQTNIWTSKTPMLNSRELFSATLGNDGNIYVFGGQNQAGLVQQVEIYNPLTDSWQVISDIPTPRTGMGIATADNGKIYTFGGQAERETSCPTVGPVVSIVEGYDPIHNSWAERTCMPTPRTLLGSAKTPSGKIYLIGGRQWITALTTVEEASVQSIRQLTALGPTNIWIGLRNSDAQGIRFDLMATAYIDNTEVASSTLESVSGGSSGFINANLQSIPLNLSQSFDFPEESNLSLKLYVRNACSGSGKNSGHARLWFNDLSANSNVRTDIDYVSHTLYFLGESGGTTTKVFTTPVNFNLNDDTPGNGPKNAVDIQTGAKCSPYKQFGTWNISP